MYKWISSFLHKRKARVTVDGKLSRKFRGSPGRSYFTYTLSHLHRRPDQETPKGIKAALYADDLVMWCTEEYATTATYRMQYAVNVLATWAKR